jgi:5-methylcytosine-specific restriction enzyme B
LLEFLSDEDRLNLKNENELMIWGNKPSLKSRWDKLRINDWVLFYQNGNITYAGKLLYKTHNKKLAENLWGSSRSDNGEIVYWEYVFFLKDVKPVNKPYKLMSDLAGYKGSVVQGFLPYSQTGVENIIEKYGTIDNFFFESKTELIITLKEFDVNLFFYDVKESGLQFSKLLINRFVASLCTKPFLILSGLSGSGKTKLAQAFAQWICQDYKQFCIVPVGADWTNREPLLGYPNALKPDEYIKPDNGALDVIIEANKHPELPYFLILDEMNLSHVERYFADFLSVMESKGDISLFAEGVDINGVSAKLSLPTNLFIIGTVNIDETTYMFSPKVLDRANAIEFRVTKDEIENFFANKKEVDMDKLRTKGASMAQSFLKMAETKVFAEQDLTETHKTLVTFFEQLKKTGAEFGYRSATEIIRLINQLSVIDSDLTMNEKLDIAIMQKLLPKLHGSRRKLCPVLLTLGGFCVDKAKLENIEKDVFAKEDFNFKSEGVIYPISLEKIARMYKGAIENGFASYAEA